MKAGLLILIGWLLVVVMILSQALFYVTYAEGLDDYYVICKPDSYVNIRASPSKRGEVLGRVECGEVVHSDGKRDGQYLHCIDLPFEDSEGWIHAGYIVTDEPIMKEGERYVVVSRGRVALRKTVNGRRRAWAKTGSNLKVIVWSDEWSLTNRGFIRSEYLEYDPE